MTQPHEIFYVAGGRDDLANDAQVSALPDHLSASWENPLLVLAEMGSLEYPSECPNHHLAVDNFQKWRRNHLKRKRHRFNQRFIKRWGKRPSLMEGSSAEGPSRLFDFISCHRDLVAKEVFTKLDNVAKQNVALVCKAWDVDIREITPPPNYARTLVHRAFGFIGEYYKALVSRGPNGSIYTIQYKCACQRWNEEIQLHGRVDWALVEPSDDEFEDYLVHGELLDAVANTPSDEEEI
ncbi:hypothetical protein BVRB_1g015700 [Beta vulgaris subsp. vulgaris]|nr:hypothetical protein BVRB_1g015700 [Beta vulgaris subsp. vulgaris]